ncbi:UNVERIFIED_CONTAM: hypothetical protein PYX00_006879 [Menopon gallinae]|uniref:CRAL-TRIO domain-containing protein n=1 Tax=Menopon gallinae TaxID=328185 RepID=A0AAW2HYP4_9NEOP
MAVEEDPNELKRKIELLRELVATEKELDVRTDDNFMLRYLRCSEHDPDAAFHRMKSYYQLKFKYPNWFSEAPDSVGELLSKGYFYVLSARDREGRIVYVNELGAIKEKSSMAHQSQLHDIFIEVITDDEEAQRKGVCVIVDVRDVSWKMMKWLTPGNIRVAVRKAETIPVKKIAYHVVNPNIILNLALKVILPFLSSAIKENIHIHNTWSSLHRIIDPDCLPVTYGGTMDLGAHKMFIDTNSEKLLRNLRLGYKKNSSNACLDT